MITLAALYIFAVGVLTGVLLAKLPPIMEDFNDE